MNILLFNHYAGSPKMGMEFRPYYLAQEWVKKGHNVTIVAGTQSHIRKVNIELKEKYRIDDIDGIKYIWIKTRPYSGNGVGRIFNMFDYIKGIYRIFKQLKKLNPDAVIASSTYPLDNYPAYKLAKKTGAKYFYEVHDLWPLSPQLLGGYSKWHPFIVFMQLAETFAYKHVDKVISILPCAEQHMISHGLQPGKFVHVPNGIYLPEVENPEALSFEMVKNIPEDKKIIGYCGTLGIANNLDKLIETAQLAQEKNPDYFFAIVGKGPEKTNLQRLINEKKLKNILIFDAIPKPQVQSFLKKCSVIILILQNSELFNYGISPNKLFDYMYSGVPVIQALKAGNDIPSESGCGLSCSNSPEDIKATIDKIMNLPESEKEKMGRLGHEFVLKNHTYEVLAEKFINAIK